MHFTNDGKDLQSTGIKTIIISYYFVIILLSVRNK